MFCNDEQSRREISTCHRRADKSLNIEAQNKRIFSRKCTSDRERRDIAYDEVIASVNYFINIKRHQQIVPTFGSTFAIFWISIVFTRVENDRREHKRLSSRAYTISAIRTHTHTHTQAAAHANDRRVEKWTSMSQFSVCNI